jgi:hypothetical protein
MTVATIAGRIPAATVAVAVSAVEVDAAAVDVPDQAAAICRRPNMLRRKDLKAGTIRAGIREAMSRVRKARIVARNPADSSHAAQPNAVLIIAAPKHRGRPGLRQLPRTSTPLKSRSCFQVNRSQNIAASPSQLPVPRQSSRNPATKHPRPPKIHDPLLDPHRHRNRLLPLAESCHAASLVDFPDGCSPMQAQNPKPHRSLRTKTLA